jgi:hypothetical protein
VTEQQITQAATAFENYFHLFECMYGWQHVTPNMHMLLHLSDFIRRFGPPAAFWLFPMERYNGTLGRQHSNKRSIEQTLLRTFVNYTSLLDMPARVEDFAFNTTEQVSFIDV